jgi:hypothetical protein
LRDKFEEISGMQLSKFATKLKNSRIQADVVPAFGDGTKVPVCSLVSDGIRKVGQQGKPFE